jgi:SAM-dependent methyltransferase
VCADLANVALVAADIAAVPTADAAFDAIRVERVLQHVADPARVVGEIARLVRPGGRVALSEPDWSTFAVSSDCRRVADIAAEAWTQGFRQPRIARALPGMLDAAGLAVVDRLEHDVAATDLETAETLFDLDATIARCVAAGRLDATDAAAHRLSLARKAAAGDFRAAVVIVTLVAAARS